MEFLFHFCIIVAPCGFCISCSMRHRRLLSSSCAAAAEGCCRGPTAAQAGMVCGCWPLLVRAQPSGRRLLEPLCLGPRGGTDTGPVPVGLLSRGQATRAGKHCYIPWYMPAGCCSASACLPAEMEEECLREGEGGAQKLCLASWLMHVWPRPLCTAHLLYETGMT